MKVMFAVDATGAGQDAIRQAVEILPLSGAEVVVVAIDPAAGLVGKLETQARVKSEDTGARDALRESEVILEAAGIKATLIARHGSPLIELVRAAEDHHADLIVLGRERRHPLKRLVMGSFTDEVLAQWTGPVMIMGAPRPATTDVRITRMTDAARQRAVGERHDDGRGAYPGPQGMRAAKKLASLAHGRFMRV